MRDNQSFDNNSKSDKQLSRRQLLAVGGRTAGLAALAGAATTLTRRPLLASALRPATTLKYGTLKLQLNWLINVQYGGSFLAATKGYYADAGLAVEFHPGGPNVNVEPLVVQGKADVGITDIEALSSARAAGADLVAIAAGWQVNPNCFISLASDPIKTPKGLIGKRLGVPSDSVVIVQNWLQSLGIAPSKYTIVPVQFDPTPLADKEVDAYFGIITSEPITLQLKGVKTYSMLLADYGEPEITELYIVLRSSLQNPTKRAALKAFLEGEIRGWQDFVANPASAVKLAVDDYGKSLDLNYQEQLLEAKAFVGIIESPFTKKHGLLNMGAAQINQSLRTLKLEKLPATTAMFDSSLINAVFNGKSRLS